VFELTPNPAKTPWTETVLYSFCAKGGTRCTDGADPVAGLCMDSAGRLFGTTAARGADERTNGRGGTVFERRDRPTGRLGRGRGLRGSVIGTSAVSSVGLEVNALRGYLCGRLGMSLAAVPGGP
jgi:hypothetical protein